MMADQRHERILLTQPRWLGDVLLCTPAIRALRQALPDARIDFMTEPAGAAALEDNPELSHVIVAGGGSRLAELRHIRRTAYDTVVDFRSTGSTAAVALASGAHTRIGSRGRGVRNVAYTHLLPRETAPVYMARQKLAMLRPLGIATGAADVSLQIAIGDAERQRADEVWLGAGFNDGVPVVAISAVSRMAFKQWGTTHWARTADRIADAGAQILLTSGPGEREQAAEVAALMRAPATWDYGATTVRQLAALYERCALWVGNDGGPRHIAVAAGTPTVCVIRHGHGAVWTDDTDRRHTSIEALPPGHCPPGCERCPTGNCLGHVDTELVVARALQLLSGTHP
jgi:heptosyltransferase III